MPIACRCSRLGPWWCRTRPIAYAITRACERSILVSDVPALAVKGLLAGYGQARVLHGLDFALARGEMVVVIGRNGVGKTTLIETLCGLPPQPAWARVGPTGARGVRIAHGRREPRRGGTARRLDHR